MKGEGDTRVGRDFSHQSQRTRAQYGGLLLSRRIISSRPVRPVARCSFVERNLIIIGKPEREERLVATSMNWAREKFVRKIPSQPNGLSLAVKKRLEDSRGIVRFLIVILISSGIAFRSPGAFVIETVPVSR